MKIIHFNVNSRSFNITSNSIITVHNNDKKVLKKYCEKNKLYPYRVYTLFNYPQGMEEIVAYYLKYKFYKYHKISFKSELLIVWDILLNNFNNNNFLVIPDLLKKFNSIDIILDLEKLKKDLKTIVFSFIVPFFEQGLFLNKTYAKKRKRSTENTFNDYYSLRDKLNSLIGKTYILNLDSYIEDIKNILPTHGDSLENKFHFISIYFYNIALYHYKNKNYTTSFNMLHRMLDIYFEYLCKIDSLSPSKNYLWNKYEELASSRSSFSFSTSEENLIKELNQSRNKLYLTHDLYSIKKSENKKMLLNLRNLIESKTGRMWTLSLNKVIFSYKIKPLDLFKDEPSFNTFFKNITHEFKY